MSPVSPSHDSRQSTDWHRASNGAKPAALDMPLLDAVLGLVPDAAVAVDEQCLLCAIVSSSDDAIVSMTAEGLVTSWNPGAEALLGYRPDEMVGQAVTVLVPDDRRGEDEVAFKGVLAGQHPVRYETRRRGKDGGEVDVEVALSVVHDPSGRPLGVAAVLRDITERRQAEAELARVQLAHERLMMATDRDRIASDLHGLVIQRLFAAGMALHGVASLVDHPEAAARIRGVVDVLDATIADLRSTIFALELHRDRSSTGPMAHPAGSARVELAGRMQVLTTGPREDQSG